MDKVCFNQMEEDLKKLDDLGKLKVIQCGQSKGAIGEKQKIKLQWWTETDPAKLGNSNFITEIIWRQYVKALGNVTNNAHVI